MSISVLEHPRAQLALTLSVALVAFGVVSVRDQDRARHAREVSPLPMIRSDRSRARRVATFRGDALPVDFALSPDGSRFLFVDSTGTFTRAALDRETATIRRGPPGIAPAWFGEEIWLRRTEQPGYARLMELVPETEGSAAGSGVERDAITAVATADARVLAYLTSAGAFIQRSGEARALYRAGPGERLASLALSPDARYLAFLRQTDPAVAPALMLAQCVGPSAPREVIADHRFAIGATRLAFIAPDRLAIGLRTDEGSRLAHLAFDPSSARLLRAPRVVPCPHRECALVAGSADGRTLLIEAWDPDLEPFTARVDSDTLEEETSLALGSGAEVPTAWSADGASLACRRPFGCVRAIRTDDGLLLTASTEERARRVPLPAATTSYRIGLTPDGRIAIFSRTRASAQLHYHRFFDRGPSRLGPAPLPTWICDPMDLEVEDDERVLLTCAAGLVRWAPFRDEHTILSEGGRPIHHLVLAPDGVHVAYARERHAVHLYVVGIDPPSRL